MSVAAVGCGGTSSTSNPDSPPSIDAKPPDARPPDAPPPDAAAPDSPPPKPDGPDAPPAADACVSDTQCSTLTAAGNVCVDGAPFHCADVGGGCLKATALTACDAAAETCDAASPNGCSCNADTGPAATSGECAAATTSGNVCSATGGSIFTCTVTMTAAGNTCRTSVLEEDCVAPLSCPGNMPGTVGCNCPAAVDASAATGGGTLGCAAPGVEACGADMNVDICQAETKTGKGCLVWTIFIGEGTADNPEGNCVGGGDADFIAGSLICVGTGVNAQCQCPPNQQSSDFYANTLPEVAAKRKPRLSQDGLRTPAVCSYDHLYKAVTAAKTNQGATNLASPFSRAVMSRVGASAAGEPVVFDDEVWNAALTDPATNPNTGTPTRKMEISTHIRLTTERDPDIGIPPEQWDAPGPEPTPAVGLINPNLYIVVVNGGEANRMLYFSGVPSKEDGSVITNPNDVGGKGRGFTVMQGAFVASPDTPKDNSGVLRPLVLFDGYGADNVTENARGTIGGSPEPRLDRVVVEGGGGDTLAFVGDLKTNPPTGAAITLTFGNNPTVLDRSDTAFCKSPKPKCVTVDLSASSTLPADLGDIRTLQVIDLGGGPNGGVYSVIGNDGDSTIAIYAPQITDTVDIASGTFKAFGLGNRNIGVYVGSTRDNPAAGAILGLTSGRATGGAFDSIVVKDFTNDAVTESNVFVSGIIVHGTYEENVESLRSWVTFFGPIVYNNYQGLQVDRSSIVHLPAAQSLLAVNSAAMLAAPGFIPTFNSSAGTAAQMAAGQFGGPNGAPNAAVIAHSGQAGIILPPDVTCADRDSERSGFTDNGVRDGRFGITTPCLASAVPGSSATNHLRTSVDAHAMLITDTTFDSLDRSLVGLQLSLGREGTGIDNAQGNATVFLDNSRVESSGGTGVVVENGVDFQPQKYNIQSTRIETAAATNESFPATFVKGGSCAFSVNCPAKAVFGVVSFHATASVIGNESDDLFGNANGVQVLAPGGHALIDGASHVDHNTDRTLQNDCVESNNAFGHVLDEGNKITCVTGFGILADAHWPSDIDVQSSSVSGNEEAGIQIDGKGTQRLNLNECAQPIAGDGVPCENWSIALRVEKDSAVAGPSASRGGSAVDGNGLEGVLAAGNSTVWLTDSEFNANGVANSCDEINAERHEYGVSIVRFSILTGQHIDVIGNLGGGVFLDTQCHGDAGNDDVELNSGPDPYNDGRGESNVGVKCAPVGSDGGGWPNTNSVGGGPNRLDDATVNLNGTGGNDCTDRDDGEYLQKHADGIEVSRKGWLQFVNNHSSVDQNAKNGIRVEGLVDQDTASSTGTLIWSTTKIALAAKGAWVTRSGNAGLRVDDDGWVETTLSTFGDCRAATGTACDTVTTDHGNGEQGAFVLGHLESLTDAYNGNGSDGIQVNETTEDAEDNVNSTAIGLADDGNTRGLHADNNTDEFSPTFFTTTVTHGQIATNGGHGIHITSAPYFTSSLAGGAVGSCGAATPISSESCFVLSWAVTVQQDNQLQHQTEIFSNTGNGIQAGGATQLDDIWMLSQNTHIHNNSVGIAAESGTATTGLPDPTTGLPDNGFLKTAITIFGNEIELNKNDGKTAAGIYVRQAYIALANSGAGISGNVIGDNGWVDNATCIADLNAPPPGTADEVSSQTEFEQFVPQLITVTRLECAGPGNALGSAVCDQCTNFDNEVSGNPDDVIGCNADRTHHCIYNSAAPSLKCRRAYDIGTVPPMTGQPCTDTNANTVSGYHRSGPENEDVRVGVVAKDGAWVNTEADHFLTSSFEQHQDWTAIGNLSFASNAGTVCSPAVSKCPPIPPVSFP